MSNAERALMSCISQDPAVVGAEVMSAFGSSNPFADEVCWRVYNAWRVSGVKTFDFITISAVLMDKATIDLDWMHEIRAVINTVPSTVNWRQYFAAVKEEYCKRLAKKELESALAGIDETADVCTYVQGVSSRLTRIDTSSEEEQSVEAAMAAELERRRNDTLNILTGLGPIDALLGPLIPGDIMCLAARPSVGKSVVAHNIAKNIAMRGTHVGLFSLEMPIPQVVARIISSVAEYDGRLVLDNMHNQSVHQAYEWVKSLPIYYDDRSGLHIAQIVNRIRRWHTNHGIKVVVLDYIQLVKTNNRKNNEGISDALKEIKAVCGELKIVPILLAQVNRAGAKNEDGRPTMEDLKGSGSLEEDSSYVVLMHRDINLTRDQLDSIDNGGAVPIEFRVAKNRHGATGFNTLAFAPKYCRVLDRQEEIYEKD